MATMDYSHNKNARLLPTSRGLLYFAYSAASDIHALNCRLALSPAYSTILNDLEKFGEQEAWIIKDRGQNPDVVGAIVFDNVQNHKCELHLRMGRLNTMNVGIAGTYFELNGVAPSALNLPARRRLLDENLRKGVSVGKLSRFIDWKHVDNVMSLHWLLVLAEFVPHASSSNLKEHVMMLFRTRCRKLQLPVQANAVHPLAPSSKNETVITELKDGLVDMLEQIGQTTDQYNEQFILMGGDGLSYDKMLQQKRLHKRETNTFRRFEVVEPVLAQWHTHWTDLCRIVEKFWGSPLSSDPSTLGHSAAKIGRPPPPNPKKADYYPFSELIYLICRVRMLHCWG